ncbi:MAG: hypothetical protein A2719_04075 [Candidatus Ryanbacteria bacterium RIFCSPHIGHO2_01_FULL_45_22]|uniref:Uncharacterized protein n=1 Tax=Candidatus Ryanbacteria bacterium RIFCSPHIGHO2_01_FULL_45_22 TaxID=1802114 RepID=A0A1G2G2N6_9BACT|nr:MAG: hypothetical protein A2719_04075 [Candidatus Ryanbacteria bacterium RIFCSPHIGHO2_01_FULL_45_22]
MNVKGIILGIVVAFGFAEYVGKFSVILVGIWLGLDGGLLADLVNANYVISIVLGVLVYRYYAKKVDKGIS